MIRFSILLFYLIVSAFVCNAQFLEFGGGLGGSNVRTDLGYMNIRNTRYGGDLFFRYNFNEIWVLRTELKYERLASSDKYYNSLLSSLRDYSFYSHTVEGSVNVEYNFLNYRSLRENFRWSPFVTAGLGSFLLFGGSHDASKGINIGVPFGLGIKYKLSTHWNLGMMFITTKTFTDKLDGVYAGWPTTKPINIQGVDESTNDWYYYLGFTVSYTIYKLKCPDYFQDITVPDHWQKSK